MNRESIVKRIMSGTDIDSNGCMVWRGAKSYNGYGVITVDGKSTRVHRLVWKLSYGEIPSGVLVCHTCDNPSCCRPDHLFLGSHKDNAMDRVSKGRNGERSRGAKLTKEDAAQIKVLGRQGTKVVSLARDFNVAVSTVYSVLNGSRWSNVETGEYDVD